jgi:adenylosuccinate synthase
MANTVVIGSQWGDEGKAKIVDFLTLEADVVIRFQGGANAGHTVVVDGESFIFHLIPAGVMHADKICVIGNGVVLDPAQLLAEIAEVKGRGIAIDGRLKIADNAQVVLPFHKMSDQLQEKAAGKHAIGTTGRGIGPCYSDKVNRLGVRIGDLLDREELQRRIEALAAVRNNEFVKLYGAAPLAVEPIVEEYAEYGRRLAPYVCDVTVYLDAAQKEGKRLIFEGAQGTVLDVDHGTYPYVTSSNTVAGSAACGSGVGPTTITRVVGVVKAYTTRVGNGPFPTEQFDEVGEKLSKIGQEFGATTGRKRRCGWFDAPVVRKAAMVNGLTHLAITKVDVLDTFEKIQICTGYRIDGKVYKTIPNRVSLVGRAEPIYEEMPGWNVSTAHCTKWSDLPLPLQNYLNRLSELLEVPVGWISVGPSREQTITIVE